MSDLEQKTDRELVADTRMLVAELSKVTEQLGRRSIEFDLLTYEGGKVEAKNFQRITKASL